MRKIEREMLVAIEAKKSWKKDNTEVRVNFTGHINVYLYGDNIAHINQYGDKVCNVDTLAAWPTPTTKSRLRALGFDVTTIKGVTYLDDIEV